MDIINEKFSNEKQILFMIKYAPPIFILIITTIIMIFVYKEFNLSFELKKQQIKDSYIKENSVIIKKELEILDNVISKIKTNEINSILNTIKVFIINEDPLIIKDIDNNIIFSNNNQKINNNFISFSLIQKDFNWKIEKFLNINKVYEIIYKEEENLKKIYNDYLFNIFILSTVLIFILLIISAFVSEYLNYKFYEYKSALNKYMKENLKQQEISFQQSKLASMGEMINNISHQWRQPLSLISTLSSGALLQKQYNLISDEDLYKQLEKITETSTYLSKTIEEFRDFLKIDSEKKMFLLSSTIEKLKVIINTSLEQNNILLFINIQKNITLFSHENELLQIIINIINNANDILIENKYLKEKLIIINIYVENNYINIKIKDNGGGIKDNIKNKIFDPYFTTKHQMQGTGLGLYMSKQILENNLKGKLTCDNDSFFYKGNKYKGALFSIKIPLN
jgi:signal transduction histidine kinase